eukprot:2344559-Prymnesium_polylepis.1
MQHSEPPLILSFANSRRLAAGAKPATYRSPHPWLTLRLSRAWRRTSPPRRPGPSLGPALAHGAI